MLNDIQEVDTYHILKSPSPLHDKHIDQDQTSNKGPNNSVTFIYQALVAEFCRNVTITWMKNLINYSLFISVESPSDEQSQYTCKIDLKTWQFWGKKGLKSFEIEGKRVDVYWDFRQAKFSSNPEPSSDYYVALVYDEEVVLVLGDLKKEAYKRTRRRPSLVEPILLCKKEHICGRKLFCSKAILPNNKKEYVIAIEISLSGVGDPEMWISIDGFELIHVMNLNWRFRGNESVTLYGSPLQIFWDVHDWLFSSSTNTGYGLFIFKPGSLVECSVDGTILPDHDSSCNFNNGNSQNMPSDPEFSHIVYAWKYDQ